MPVEKTPSFIRIKPEEVEPDMFIRAQIEIVERNAEDPTEEIVQPARRKPLNGVVSNVSATGNVWIEREDQPTYVMPLGEHYDIDILGTEIDHKGNRRMTPEVLEKVKAGRMACRAAFFAEESATQLTA